MPSPNDERIAKIPRRAYPVREAGRMIALSPATIYRHAKSGKIHLIRIGGRTLVPESEIARLTTEGIQK
jgi:predicted site-specific integrase-resolvase